MSVRVHLLSAAWLAALVLFAVSASTARADAPLPERSLVENSSFEGGTTDWSGYNATLASVSDGTAPHGAKALQVTKDSSADFSADGPSFVSEAGTTYTAIAWLRAGSGADGKAANIAIAEYAPSTSSHIATERDSILLDEGRWRRLEVSYTATQTGGDIKIWASRDFNDPVSSGPDVFLVDAFSLTASPTASLADGNLIENASFEEDADGWNTYYSEIESVSGTAPPNGTKALEVARDGSADFSAGSDPTAVLAGRTYRAVAWVRGSPDTDDKLASVAIIEFAPLTNTIVDAGRTYVTLSASRWKRVEVTYEATQSGTIGVWVGRDPSDEPDANDEYYVDAVSLTRDPLADPRPRGNLLSNSSFEADTSTWTSFNSSLASASNSDAPEGARVMEVTKVGSNADFGADGPTFTAIPGKTYTAVAWLRAGSASASGRSANIALAEYAPSPGGHIATVRESVSLSSDRWKRVELAYEATQAGTIGVWAARDFNDPSSSGDDILLVDGFSVVERDTPDTAWQIALIGAQDTELAGGSGGQYRYIVVRDGTINPANLRSAYPGADILLYKNGAFSLRETVCNDGVGIYGAEVGGGIPYCQAIEHESWILHSGSPGTDQNRVFSTGYEDLMMMNIGNRAYQEQWIDNVKERVTDWRNNSSSADYFDGIFVDDINLDIGHGVPTTSELDGENACFDRSAAMTYCEAVTRFIRNVGEAFQADDKVVVPNLSLERGDTQQVAAARDLIAPSVSAIHQEAFARYFIDDNEDGNLDPENEDDVDVLFTDDAWLQEVRLMEQLQKRTGYLALSYGLGDGEEDDRRAQRFLRGTFLLGWDGNDASAFAYRPTLSPVNEDPANLDDWQISIGLPAGARTAISGTAFYRRYTGGVVVVNANSSGSVTFNPGFSFQEPGESCTSSKSVPPGDAVIAEYC